MHKQQLNTENFLQRPQHGYISEGKQDRHTSVQDDSVYPMLSKNKKKGLKQNSLVLQSLSSPSWLPVYFQGILGLTIIKFWPGYSSAVQFSYWLTSQTKKRIYIKCNYSFSLNGAFYSSQNYS